MLALMGAMFGFLFDMMHSRSQALEQVRQHQAAAALVKHLEDELLTCVAWNGAAGAGVKGDGTNICILSRGVTAGLAAQGLEAPGVLGDLQQSEYRFDAERMHIEGRRVAVTREAAAPAFSPIQGVVYKLRFRYHDGKAWQDSFDSAESGRLPRAVEVALWLRPLPEQAAMEELNAQFTPAHSEEAVNFDDETFARLSDLDLDEPPLPDRLRVIVITDAEPDTAPERPTPIEEPAT